MKKVVFLLLVLLIMIQVNLFAIDIQALSKVTIAVVGEDNGPISDAKVSISFEQRDPSKVIQKKGLSDANGVFFASDQAFLGKIYYGVEKHGWYKSVGKYEFKDNALGRWNPWNPELKVILRKIEKPAPMYARDSVVAENKIELPILGEEIGFDLIAYDWIAPYGLGTHADIYFKIEKRIVGPKNFESTLTIRFPDQFAGLQVYREDTSTSYGSGYPLPRMAPLDGYQNSLKFFMGRAPDNRLARKPNFIEKDINYIFRTRTVVKDGKLVKAMYGKIHGPIDFNPLTSDTAKIYIKYYLNPDYTRNLEFDPERNLFGSLPPLEQVGIK